MEQIILSSKNLDSIVCAALMEMMRNKDLYPKTLPVLKELIKFVIANECDAFKITTEELPF